MTTRKRKRKMREFPLESSGAYLRAWRIAKEMTLVDLGEKTGDSKDQISRWETGEVELKADKAMQLAKALGIEPWQLFTDPSKPMIVLTGEEAALAQLLRQLEDQDLARIAESAQRYLELTLRKPRQDQGA